MKKTAIGLIVLMMISSLGCGTSKNVRIRLDGDKAVDIRTGQMLEIELEANPTTGYDWEVKGPAAKGVLRPAGTEYLPGSRLVGAGGIRIFRFEAAGSGQAELVFGYRRPWGEKPPIKRHVVRVTVR